MVKTVCEASSEPVPPSRPVRARVPRVALAGAVVREQRVQAHARVARLVGQLPLGVRIELDDLELEGRRIDGLREREHERRRRVAQHAVVSPSMVATGGATYVWHDAGAQTAAARASSTSARVARRRCMGVGDQKKNVVRTWAM